jgi:hypothetical protein
MKIAVLGTGMVGRIEAGGLLPTGDLRAQACGHYGLCRAHASCRFAQQITGDGLDSTAIPP